MIFDKTSWIIFVLKNLCFNYGLSLLSVIKAYILFYLGFFTHTLTNLLIK